MNRWRVLARLAGVVVFATALSGCLDLGEGTIDVEPSSLWQATLDPVITSPEPDQPRVTGNAGAVVQSGMTRLGIGLEGVTERLEWGLFQGTCDESGSRVQSAEDYPPLQQTNPETEISLGIELSIDGTYHVRVGTDQAVTQLVACGELLPLDEV